MVRMEDVHSEDLPGSTHREPVERHTTRRTVQRITIAAIVVNVLLAALKLVCGILGRSRAVTADGLHTLADLSTDIAVLIGVQFWSAPPDRDHPYGHARIESVVAGIIGVVVGGAAPAFAFDAVRAILTSGAGVSTIRGTAPLLAACTSIVVKEGLYHWVRAVGRQCGSSALEAASWHHRADALSSVPAALAAGASKLVPSAGWIDPVGALIVAGVCLHAARQILGPVVAELTERGAEPDVLGVIRVVALKTPGVRDVHGVRTRRMGRMLFVDLHVLVDPDLTVREGHDIAEEVKRRLLNAELRVGDVVVHIEPWSPIWRPRRFGACDHTPGVGFHGVTPAY